MRGKRYQAMIVVILLLTALPYSPFLSRASSIDKNPIAETDIDGDGIPDPPFRDSDGDGFGDNSSGVNPDAFSNDPTQLIESDGDGFGNNPLGDQPDNFPDEPTQWIDSDGDGFGDRSGGHEGDA